MNTEYRTPGFGISNIFSTDGGVSWCWSNAAGEGSGESNFEAAVASAEAALTDATHHVDLDSGEDILTINGVPTTPRRVLGIGSNLWVWTHDGVYHAADWSGDLDDVTPLVEMSEAYYLGAIAETISSDVVAHVLVCEFSVDDPTPTLHINLWRGVDLMDLPQLVAELVVVAEGNWDGGRSYSLKIA